jgi:tetratricopeptide (TPR) repeat protein
MTLQQTPATAEEANLLLREVDTHLAAGRPAEARPLIEAVLRLAPDHPQILQLHAIALRALGENESALEAATRALTAAPGDARIADTLGNVLGDLGHHQDALAAYDRALAVAPDFAEAALHRAMTLHALGRPNAAREAFIAVGTAAGVKGPVARALLEIEEGAVDNAAILFEQALTIEPGYAPARHGRLRVAIDRGEAGALDVLRQVQESEPDQRGLLLDRLEIVGDAAALAQAESLLAADLDWHAGRNAIARWRRERAGRDDWLALHRDALAATPTDDQIWRDLIGLHAAVDEFAAAAEVADRAAAATGDATFGAAAFGFHSASGQFDAAERLFARPAVARHIDGLAVAKLRLAQGDLPEADMLLAEICEDEGVANANIEAWALRGLLWQMSGDARFAWLNDQPGMIADLDLGFGPAEIDAIVARLTALHDDAIINLGQSVRGGTQTYGNLFDRIDPEIRMLRDAIIDAVERYRAALPPADPAHPLLRHRDRRLRLTSSWSVRLAGDGFHVSHIHPKGIFSSASYWLLPPADAGDPQSGWLELGRAPAYLGLDVAPIRVIEPRVGRLILFPSTLHHGTRPIASGERITAAFDVAPASEL